MPAFKQPASEADARERRAALVARKSELLRQRPARVGAARAAWVGRVTAIDDELSFLKQWLHIRSTEDDDEKRRWGVVTDPDFRKHEFGNAVKSFMEYVLFLERENAELRAENERLKAENQRGEAIEF